MDHAIRDCDMWNRAAIRRHLLALTSKPECPSVNCVHVIYPKMWIFGEKSSATTPVGHWKQITKPIDNLSI